MRCKRIFILVFAFLLLGAVSASFSFKEDSSSITTNYEMSDYLRAKINISFFNESLNSNFTDSLGNTISLKALLLKTPEYSYIFYDITNKTILSAYQLLDIGKAGFAMPSQIQNFSYTLNLGGVNVFGKTFRIMSNKNLVQGNIDKKYSEINVTKFEMRKYSPFVQKSLNESLNIPTIESNLKKIQADYAKATTNADYTKILNNLSNITLPKDISETISTDFISFYPTTDNVNLDILQTLGGDYSEDPEGYTGAIYSWNEKNVKAAVKFSEILVIYESGEESILKVFEFRFNKGEMENESYFIVKNMENLKFGGDYPQIEEPADGYTFIKFNEVSGNILFSTTEDVDFINVPVFISPSLEDLPLPIVGPFPPFIEEHGKWIIFGVIVFIVLLIGIITYVMLQMWYRRKYENYLFKNRNNLYNIMTYIQNAKKKGMERGDILKDLKKANWTREQINYAIQKYEGKKIAGIIEIPFKRFAQEQEKAPSENQKNNSELESTKV